MNLGLEKINIGNSYTFENGWKCWKFWSNRWNW